jgi:D-glycero-D-manno-heptose 1,7-bisphosphate phosphatase
VVTSINDLLKVSLPIDAIRTCFHRNEDMCCCRKPSPGLILEAAKDFNIDLKNSFMIGDRWRDIEAGTRAGCKNFFIDYGYQEIRPRGLFRTVKSLLEAARIIKELS